MPAAAADLLVAVAAIALLAGLIQGLAGFGAALIAVPLLLQLLPIKTVVPLMAFLGASISVLNLLHLRRAVRLEPVLPLLGGYLVGTPIGLFALKHAPEAVMLAALGGLLCVYALLSLSGRQPRARWLRDWRVGLGAVSGALGSAFSTNGPPVILHVAAHTDWQPDQQKATLALFFLLSSVITLLAFGISGLITKQVLVWLAWSIPTLSLGALAGIYFYRRLGQHHYRRLTFGLILTIGVLLLARSLGNSW
jgi:hypothetical protein